MTPLAQRTPASSPFAILYQPRAIPDSKTPPKKSGPNRTKLEWALISVESSAQRKDRQTAEKKARKAKILRENKHSDCARSTRGAADRSAQIRTSGVC